MKVGIIGLPNVGKSTLFEALTQKQVAREARPFTTIDPNKAVLEIPDQTLNKLSELLEPPEVRPATITFLDIAGLIEGAHEGEGLGNEFLSHIAQADLLIHVLRVFEDKSIAHSSQSTDPKEQSDIINNELEQYDTKIQENDPSAKKISEMPQVYVFNLEENQEPVEPPTSLQPAIQLSAQAELELQELPSEEQTEYRKTLSYPGSLEKLTKTCYDKLELLTFYTVKGGKILQAHALEKGSTAKEAAAKVHTDLSENFIRAEITPAEKLLEAGSWAIAKENGLVATRGEDYEVQDGEVIEIKT